MKKLLPFLILLSACQKDEITNPEKSGELHAVTFSLSDFTQKMETMARKTVWAETDDDCLMCYEYPSELRSLNIHYFAYDEETGELVSQEISRYLEQGSGDKNENYGKFTDSLQVGKYDIVFVMSRHDSEGGYIPAAIWDYKNFNNAHLYGGIRDYHGGVPDPGEMSIEGIPDMFFKHMKLEVSGDIVMNDITLPRIVGELEVRITDDVIPDSVYIFPIHPTFSGFPLNLEDASYGKGGLQRGVYIGTRTDSGYIMSGYIVPDIKTGKLTMDVGIISHPYGSYNYQDTIAYKLVKNVEIQANRKTILTGKLFDDLSQEFTVKVDSSWSDGEVIEF